MLHLRPMSYTSTVKRAFLNKHAQSCLKPARALVVETWKVLIPICRVPYLWKRDARNLKDCHIRQSSNMNLFGAQRRRETAKPLQFLELMKTILDCGRNTRQRSAGVRRHEGNLLDPRKDDFLKLIMQSSRFFQDKLLYCIVLTARTAALSFFQNPALDRESNLHAIIICI